MIIYFLFYSRMLTWIYKESGYQTKLIPLLSRAVRCIYLNVGKCYRTA